MAAGFSLTMMARRRLAEEDVCPLEVKYLRTERGMVTQPQTGSPTDTQDATPVSGGQMMGEKVVTVETSDDELGRLDIDLDRKSKQLNLTSSNVRAILHEVITDERVVAMMKATIRDTQDLPMFEPKIWTRSRLKQSLQPVNWGLSAVNKAPQFIDIELEDNEDSSDEEYCPDEEEEEDTTEETFLSDADSLASPPRMHLGSQNKSPTHLRMDNSLQSYEGNPRDQMSSTCAPQLLPPPESSFLERLKAVDEELDYSPSYTYGQSLDRKSDDDDGGVDNGSSSLAYRTRSKRPLVDVPLGQLEAELLPPDVTADMYDESSAQREEDRHWTKWLQGLMAPDFEEEAEDDDDPEYNFPEDLDEPDLEDYRTDRAVQITKKEVNELLEELFETLQEEEGVVAEEEEHEEEEPPSQTGLKFNVPQALRFEAPLANMLTERRQTVRKQYEAQQQRRALQDTTNHLTSTLKDTPTPPHNAIASVLVLPRRIGPSLHLDLTQKLQLQQQLQQHVQLLTQVHLLSRHIAALNHEAFITKRYLEELQHFARHQEQGCAFSCFRACNLQGALDLLHEVEQRDEPPPAPPTRASRRWLPQMTPATNSLAYPLLPADTAWLFATRPVFLYPELLPVCSLDPALHSKNLRTVYTAGEDGLIVLGLKHFEGGFQSDELISSYLLCKSRWNFRKHVREMSGPRAPDNVIKTFVTEGVIPPLPLACSRVQSEDQHPPVDRDGENMPNWLKNSRPSIQKTQSDAHYPPWLPAGCTLRLHPNYINRYRPRPRPHRRVFTLAHNESLLPLAKAQEDPPVERQGKKQVDMHFLPVSGVTLLSAPSAMSGALPLAPASICGAVPLTAVHPGPDHPVCAKVMQSCFPIGQNTPQTVSAQESPTPSTLLLPIPSLTSPSTTKPTLKPGCLLLQMVWTPPAPPTSPQNTLEQHIHGPISEQQEEAFSKQEKLKREEEESMVFMSTLSLTSCAGDEEEEERREDQRQEQEEKETVAGVSLNGGENNEQEQWRGGGGGEGEEGGGAGESEQGGEEEEGRQREERSGARDDGGEKDKDEDQDRHGDDEEEEDFDDLTQDEDEEEVMSSASEESVLSVPELQETMKQLTWLAAERRLCTDGDSEEEHSPTSPGSQEEEEEEEEGPKGEDSGEGRSNKAGLDEETPSRDRTPGGVGGRCPGRGRGRSRPHRGLRRSRQERHSKDGTKLLLLYDENILDNDPHRESKDMAFAQSYLSRVREALREVPEQVEEFVSLLNEFEQVGDGQEVMQLFRKLRCILGNRTDLLQDFAAFLHPEQALLCGLFEEQQAFERSRRFLRQLEISFGDNPSHYQKVIKALQIGQDLSPTSIHELKAQMSMLLKGHTHLQAEFWVFFDELRPPPAHPGQFEETHWPEDGGAGSEGGEGVNQDSGGGASGGFEEVTLPEVEEEEEGHKIQPMTNRRQRRKMDSHRNYKGCDWSNKDWACLCRDSKIQKHKRKGCSCCHGNKTSGGMSRAMKSLDPLYSQISAAHDEPGNKDLDLKGGDDSPQPDRCGASWEGSFPLADTKEEEDEEEEKGEEEEEERKKEPSPAAKRSRREETLQLLPVTLPITSACTSTTSTSSSVALPSTTASSTSAASCAPPRPAPLPPDLPVCAKNISLTASGEKVILWTREADRVILKTCQQEGANQNTFQAISSLLGNKTPGEVSRRFRDLMHLFRTAARQTSSEDEAPPIETEAANETED